MDHCIKVESGRRNNEYVDWEELFKTPLVVEMPQVTENDIVQNEKHNPLPSWVMDFVYSKSHVYKAKSSLHDAHKKWELQFQNQRDLEFNASHLEEIMLEVGQLLGISRKEQLKFLLEQMKYAQSYRQDIALLVITSLDSLNLPVIILTIDLSKTVRDSFH